MDDLSEKGFKCSVLKKEKLFFKKYKTHIQKRLYKNFVLSNMNRSEACII